MTKITITPKTTIPKRCLHCPSPAFHLNTVHVLNMNKAQSQKTREQTT